MTANARQAVGYILAVAWDRRADLVRVSAQSADAVVSAAGCGERGLAAWLS